MKFQSNISILNSLIRITCGFTFLAWAIAKMAKKPWKQSYLFVAAMAGMKIGEGILRYCPIVDLMQQKNSDDGSTQHKNSNGGPTRHKSSEDNGLTQHKDSHNESTQHKDAEIEAAIKSFLPEDIIKEAEQSNPHNEASH